jgi:hypothetical protein
MRSVARKLTMLRLDHEISALASIRGAHHRAWHCMPVTTRPPSWNDLGGDPRAWRPCQTPAERVLLLLLLLLVRQ